MEGFETERLRMRPLGHADEPLFCSLYGSSQTMQHIGQTLRKESAAKRYARVVRDAARGRGPFLFVVEVAYGAAIGLCGVVQLDREHRRAEVGIMLLPQACARGFGSELLPSLVTSAFSAFSIDRVWVQYAPAHCAAERLAERVGFSPCKEGEIAEKCPGNRVWAVDRPLWTSRNCTSSKGSIDVEHDRFS